jgi:hypothetical protein
MKTFPGRTLGTKKRRRKGGLSIRVILSESSSEESLSSSIFLTPQNISSLFPTSDIQPLPFVL